MSTYAYLEGGPSSRTFWSVVYIVVWRITQLVIVRVIQKIIVDPGKCSLRYCNSNSKAYT